MKNTKRAHFFFPMHVTPSFSAGMITRRSSLEIKKLHQDITSFLFLASPELSEPFQPQILKSFSSIFKKFLSILQIAQASLVSFIIVNHISWISHPCLIF